MTDRLIRITTALAVVAVAVVAAVISYQHAYELVRSHRESGVTARLLPFTVDGLIWAASMVVLDASRRGQPVPRLAAWSLGAGIAATVGEELSRGRGPGCARRASSSQQFGRASAVPTARPGELTCRNYKSALPASTEFGDSRIDWRPCERTRTSSHTAVRVPRMRPGLGQSKLLLCGWDQMSVNWIGAASWGARTQITATT